MTTIVPTIQPSLDFAAQNDQLWKIIEKQRLIIQNLQKSLVKVTAERDNLLKKSRNHDLDDELTSTIIPEVDNNHHHIDNLERSSLSSSSESLQQPATYPEFSEAILLGPVPPPRSPYRQNSSKDVHNSTILHPNTPSAPAPVTFPALAPPTPSAHHHNQQQQQQHNNNNNNNNTNISTSYNSTIPSNSNYQQNLTHDKDTQPHPVNQTHANRPAPLKLTLSHTIAATTNTSTSTSTPTSTSTSTSTTTAPYSSHSHQSNHHTREKTANDHAYTPTTAGHEYSHNIVPAHYNALTEDTESPAYNVSCDKDLRAITKPQVCSSRNEDPDGLSYSSLVHEKPQFLAQVHKPQRPARVHQDHSSGSVRTLVGQELAAYALPSPMPFMSPEVHGTSVVQHNSSVDEDRFNRTQPNEFRRDFDGETLVSTSGIILSPTAMSVPITTAASMAAMAKTVTKPLPKNPFFSNMAGISVKVVGSSIKTNEKGKEAVYFIIAVIKTPDFSSSTSEELWRVEKQHSDIVTLDSQLKLQVRSAAQRIGKLPDKALFSTHAPNKVDQRKIAIEKYLQNAINVSVDDSNWLCEFLSTNVVTDQRHPSHPLGHKYGYLTKRGKNFGGWKTRYFSLEGPELHYYDGKDGPLLGTIRLYSAQIGRQTSAPQTGTDSSSDNRSFRHAFLILEPKKTAPNGVNRHVLCASSDAERDQWVEALAQYVNRQNASSEEENIKRNNNQKASKKGDKARKARSSDTVPTVPTNTKKTSYLPRSSSDTTLYPSESLSPSDATSSNTLTSIREKDIQALRDRSSADHVLFGQRQQFSKRNSISFPPREGTDELFRSSDYLSQISTTFDGNNPRPFYRSGTTDSSVEQDAKKAKQMINRRTFWGKKIFSSSSNEVLQTDIFGTAAPDSASSLGSASVTTATTMAATLTAPAAITSPSTSSSTANSNTNQSGGLRGLLSRSSSETAERAMADNKMSSTEMFGKPSRPVFGVPLEEAVRISRISEKYELPAIVYRCIEYLEAKDAFEEEGIYRLSGSAVKIKSLKDQFNQEGDINLLESEEYHDLHAVAGLLKMWLRELPGNILTSELMNDFMLVIDVIDRNERITELGRLVSLLPLANYTLLRTLSAHLVRVVQNAEINKMNMRNIGIVFSATLGIPSGIFHLLLTEFSYVFWTVNINNDDDDNDNDDSLITGGQYNYKSNVPLYQQNKDLYGLSSAQPELTLIEDSSKLHISRSMAEETSRSNRNSRSYMDGAPQIIVGLESQIELIGPLQIENNDICLDLSDFDCSENSGVSGKKFDFFKDVIEAGFPSSRQTVVKNDVHFDNSVANSY